MPIIKSIVDTDLYKLTMQWAILALFPHAKVKYSFINRRPEKRFTDRFIKELSQEIRCMSDLRLTEPEQTFLAQRCPFLPPQYLAYLQNYRFNPDEVKIQLIDGELNLTIDGQWHHTVLWETPLMAIISELWFRTIDTDWTFNNAQQRELAYRKMYSLRAHDCQTAEFGSRRRRSTGSQETFLEEAIGFPNFVGSSNVYFAHKFNTKPIGTVAHEYPQALSVLMGLRHANRFALDTWDQVYHGNLGIALPDTYGLDAFFADFTLHHAKLWDGLRWDSGCPFKFTDRVVQVYKDYGVDPTTKWGVYTNALTDKKAVEIRQYTEGKLRASFGIGTFFTNDFHKASDASVVSPAMNMVIKLTEVEGVPVVKLSEDISKTSGDVDAVKNAMWTFFRKPLLAKTCE